MSLNETLAAMGCTTRPAHQYAKHIIDRTGAVVFTGDSVEVWAWINANR